LDLIPTLRIGTNNDNAIDEMEKRGIFIARKRNCSDCWLDIDEEKIKKHFKIVLVSVTQLDEGQKIH
jgi:hypothetical protein